ncbi:IclR family transcriptional regulator [Lysinibacillus telephonicus]|uniref:IclR family transcriptional regulator n=2 Tax=Lysinibacillus telephonicus TaxID=1714840 RepID=A0A431UWF6_9BACI|nr:IclR family transcriptional regulator [Lysinibacillus telephonicus]RTQ95571.1 IclR family transcriptional regulator [Lysinibacillus telephonicus]
MDQITFQKNYTMQSVHKAIHVLRAFSKEQPRLSLTELHKKTGIGISSLQRFVSTLVYEGFLHKDEKTKEYQLGLSLLYLGYLVEQESSLLTISKPILQRINDETGESVCINIIDGDERRCIFNLDTTHPLSAKTFVGHTSPLYAGASAKCLLACLTDQELNEYFERVQLIPITNQTIIDVDALKKELTAIRSQGYALSRSERVVGAYSVSTAILLPTNRPLASISIVIPEARVEQYSERQLIDLILSAKLQIERQL